MASLLHCCSSTNSTQNWRWRHDKICLDCCWHKTHIRRTPADAHACLYNLLQLVELVKLAAEWRTSATITDAACDVAHRTNTMGATTAHKHNHNCHIQRPSWQRYCLRPGPVWLCQVSAASCAIGSSDSPSQLCQDSQHAHDHADDEEVVVAHRLCRRTFVAKGGDPRLSTAGMDAVLMRTHTYDFTHNGYAASTSKRSGTPVAF